MIPNDLVAMGVRFYDHMRDHATDYTARHCAVCYMRRKAEDAGDAMPFYEALADALALRASLKIRAARGAIVAGATETEVVRSIREVK